MATLRPVTLDELPEAPVVVRVTSHIRAPRQRVFDLLSGDPARWGDFRVGLDHKGHWVERTDDGIGAVRRIGAGPVRLTETILAKDDGKRWAFRVETSVIPLAKALIEDYVVEDSPDGCTMHWTGSVWPHGPLPLARPIMSAVLTLIVTRLGRGVERAARER